ncbi:MAG: hypothetical protein A2025_01440 [Chloroflexi bacterium RBG_19FT_COMBO_47_15]|nr:MAG: hypothetical protein A2025_01440 [Chloroflexi bacterium RBG_19FT_COMBO_47_15]
MLSIKFLWILRFAQNDRLGAQDGRLLIVIVRGISFVAISVEADVVANWRLPRYARNDRKKRLAMTEGKGPQ